MHLVPGHGPVVFPNLLEFAFVQLYLKCKSVRQKSEVEEPGGFGFDGFGPMGLLAVRVMLRFLEMGYLPSYFSYQVRQIFSQFAFSKNLVR